MYRICILIIPLLFLTACEIEKVEEGEMPDMDVETGEMPTYDIRVADIDVGMTERTIKVPQITVVMEERTVRVPYINVEVPGEENEERTIMVEVEVQGEGHNIDIEEVYLKENAFWVISRLNMNEASQSDATVRISDRVLLNAPSDVDIRHYIIGDPPPGSYNDRYRFIESKDAVVDQLSDAQKIL